MHKQYNKTIFLISIFSLTIAMFPMPYGYYQILRFLIFILMGYIAFNEYNDKYLNKIFVLSIILVILYNPLKPIFFTRNIWLFINIYSILSILFIFFLSQKNNNSS